MTPAAVPRPATRAADVSARSWKTLRSAIVLYVLTHATMMVAGMAPALPWQLLALILLTVLPFSYAIARGLFLVEQLGLRRWLIPPVGIVLGLALAWNYRLGNPVFLITCLLLFSVLSVDCLRNRDIVARPLAASIAILFFGFGTVNNLSYLGARFTLGRVHDPDLRVLDLALYRRLLSPGVTYEGLFPLTHSPVWFRLLENAYMILFAEIFVVTAVLLIARRDVIEFYRLTFACYVIGLLVFLLYPAVAPDVYYPESLRADYLGTSTAALGRNLAADYSALGRGLPLNGFGYFVALPSLHVAMALLSQALLYAFPLHFWTFLPVNLLLIVSTVVLGHHYVVDVPAGALLAAFVLAAHRALRRCPFEQPAESR